MSVTTTHSPWVIRFIAEPIDAMTNFLGRVITWLTLLMALVTFFLVLSRYVFQVNSIALQESVIYMHSLVFLLGICVTLKADEHVRVDIFYRRFSPQKKAWIDSIGNIIFLLPLSVFLFFISFNFVGSAWQTFEGSSEPGGIPAVFLLKTLIPVTAISIALQGIAITLRQIVFLVSPSLDDQQTAETMQTSEKVSS